MFDDDGDDYMAPICVYFLFFPFSLNKNGKILYICVRVCLSSTHWTRIEFRNHALLNLSIWLTQCIPIDSKYFFLGQEYDEFE